MVTTAGCPYCARVKAVLTAASIAYAEVDLAASPAALAAVKAASGRASVPQVFVGGRLLGGCDETEAALANGALAAAMAAAAGLAPLPASVAAVLGAAAPGATRDPDAGLRPPSMSKERYDEVKAVESRLAGVRGGSPVSADAAAGSPVGTGVVLAWLAARGGPEKTPLDAKDAAALLQDLAAARLVAPPHGVPRPDPAPGALVATSDPDAPLLLARRAPRAPPAAPLNARFAWVGAARPPTAVAASLRARILALYDAHLASDGRGVDYGALTADPAFADYAAAAAELQAVPLSSLAALPARERFALFVNLYNAVVVHAVAERGGPGATPGERAKFYSQVSTYDVGGLPFAADDMEHGVLRRNAPSVASLAGVLRLPWGTHFSRSDPRATLALATLDPRLHAALNCGARSCPPIKVYDAADLDAALDGAMGALCGDAAVDESRRTVTVSSIFKWYARDFRAAGADPLLPWLARFMPPPAAAAVGRMLGDGGAPPRLAYAPYDWDANSAGQGA